MSIQSQINRLSANVSDAFAAIESKGVTVPTGSKSDNLANLIGQISTGGSVTINSLSVTPSESTQTFNASDVDGYKPVTVSAISSTYVGSGVTTKGATTYNTSSSDQTIASGTYLTGTQTIRGVTYSGLSASNILSGVTVKIGDANDDDRIASVSGSVVIQHYYTGSSAPSSSLGADGDIYLQTS